MQFPILSVIVFTPIVAAILILLIPPNRKTEVRVTALAAATFAFILSAWVYFAYDKGVSGYQFVEKYEWLPQLGISYIVGVDGMNVPLVLLTGIVMFTGVLISWGLDDRPREFFAFLFILATGVFESRSTRFIHAVLFLRLLCSDVFTDRHLGWEKAK
jgi:NADH-quinone oxidoreductase subunit M